MYSIWLNLFYGAKIKAICKGQISRSCFFNSPEDEVIVLCLSCIINFLPCVYSGGHIFSLIIMKLDQNVCLDKISDEFENGSCWVKN